MKSQYILVLIAVTLAASACTTVMRFDGDDEASGEPTPAPSAGPNEGPDTNDPDDSISAPATLWTRSSGSQVSVNWTPVANAHSYQIDWTELDAAGEFVASGVETATGSNVIILITNPKLPKMRREDSPPLRYLAEPEAW